VDFELIKPDAQAAYDPAPFLNYARARSTDKQERDPDVGDVVHFWDDDAAKCMAATVTDQIFESGGQHSECLAVMDPVQQEIRWKHAIPHSEPKRLMSWHWPCGGH
jgi:hypothetical protein